MADRLTPAASETERLEAKYGAPLLRRPPLVTRERFIEKVAERDAVDQHFARIASEFAAGVCATPALDERSRFLAVIGQFTVSRSPGHLEDSLRASIRQGVAVRESLEVDPADAGLLRRDGGRAGTLDLRPGRRRGGSPRLTA